METLLYVGVGLAAIAVGCVLGVGLWWVTDGRRYR